MMETTNFEIMGFDQIAEASVAFGTSKLESRGVTCLLCINEFYDLLFFLSFLLIIASLLKG